MTTTNYFERRTRDDGTTYTTCRDDVPGWVTELVYECHDDESPNDWRYETIAAIFDAIGDGYDDASEIADSLTDVYIGDRLRWLSDRPFRNCYIEEAREELGATGDVFELIGAGQYPCIQHMAARILEAVAQ